MATQTKEISKESKPLYSSTLNGIDGTVRHNWTREEIRSIHDQPLLELVFRAADLHRRLHPNNKVQKATLLSIKTGGCSENCGYCSQSAHHKTKLERQSMMSVEDVRGLARNAKEQGSTRFCMGAAWRQVKDGPDFDRIVEMVEEVNSLGMEACVTLGMLKPHQAERLKNAGLKAYNHNLDTSENFYNQVVTTRSYQDRIDTLKAVRGAGLDMCTGGILGLGESIDDRCELLGTLAQFDPHPESVPINLLVAVEGTPLENQKPVKPFEMVRMVATTRIVMPRSRVRLSAGRLNLSPEAQALCFLSGANSIFSGDKLLTTPNNNACDDESLFAELGLGKL